MHSLCWIIPATLTLGVFSVDEAPPFTYLDYRATSVQPLLQSVLKAELAQLPIMRQNSGG